MAGNPGRHQRRGARHPQRPAPPRSLDPPRRQRLHQLGPGTWPQAAPEPGPGWQYHLPGDPVIEIAIYPEIVRLAAHNLQAQDTSHREAS
jgi:hypothetical protein